MKPVFKAYNQGQETLFPVNLDSKISQDSPVRPVNQTDDNLDISKVIDTYKGGGTGSYPPRVMLKAVIFACLSNIYSCRKIEDAIRDRFSFAWLAGGPEPDHNTVNRFRSKYLKGTISEIFTQAVTVFVETGCLSLDIACASTAQKWNRVPAAILLCGAKRWRKTGQNLKQKSVKYWTVLKKALCMTTGQVMSLPPPVNSGGLKKRISEISRENRSKEARKEIKTLATGYLPKLEEYEKHLETPCNRNSYSKTDPDATFMRLKDGHMRNGQLKAAYSLQISTENQFIGHFDFFPNPTVFLTFKPFVNGFRERFEEDFGKVLKKAVSDSGYGSEENYDFMEIKDIEPFVVVS